MQCSRNGSLTSLLNLWLNSFHPWHAGYYLVAIVIVQGTAIHHEGAQDWDNIDLVIDLNQVDRNLGGCLGRGGDGYKRLLTDLHAAKCVVGTNEHNMAGQ